jgi:hypothetical protein
VPTLKCTCPEACGCHISRMARHSQTRNDILLRAARTLAAPTSQTASRRRRSRHQHFWRNADKLPVEHRAFVESGDVTAALERGARVPAQARPCSLCGRASRCAARHAMRSAHASLHARAERAARPLAAAREPADPASNRGCAGKRRRISSKGSAPTSGRCASPAPASLRTSTSASAPWVRVRRSRAC